MIRLREYLADPEVFLSPEVTRLRAHLRVFFSVLFFATDGAGRFIADAAQLRAVLYTGALQHVSVRDVQGWLVELHAAGLIKLYTAQGLAYGKVTKVMWRQRDKMRKEIHPDEAAPPPEPELFSGQAPELNRREWEGGMRDTRTGTPPPNTFQSRPKPIAESESAWLERLELSYPHLDIAAELAAAHRKNPHGLERGYFEKSWLPHVTPKAPRTVSRFQSPSVGDGPAGWRAALETLRPGNLISPDLGRSWADVPPDIRAQITGQQTAA